MVIIKTFFFFFLQKYSFSMRTIARMLGRKRAVCYIVDMYGNKYKDSPLVAHKCNNEIMYHIFHSVCAQLDQGLLLKVFSDLLLTYKVSHRVQLITFSFFSDVYKEEIFILSTSDVQ